MKRFQYNSKRDTFIKVNISKGLKVTQTNKIPTSWIGIKHKVRHLCQRLHVHSQNWAISPDELIEFVGTAGVAFSSNNSQQNEITQSEDAKLYLPYFIIEMWWLLVNRTKLLREDEEQKELSEPSSVRFSHSQNICCPIKRFMNVTFSPEALRIFTRKWAAAIKKSLHVCICLKVNWDSYLKRNHHKLQCVQDPVFLFFLFL